MQNKIKCFRPVTEISICDFILDENILMKNCDEIHDVIVAIIVLSDI